MSVDESSWRTAAFRQSVVVKIDEAIQRSGMPTSKNSMEMENHVFQKAKTKEEYLGFVARLILHVREMNSKKAAGMGGPNPAMPDPINALQTLARQGTGNNQMMGMGGPQGVGMVQPPQSQVAAATQMGSDFFDWSAIHGIFDYSSVCKLMSEETTKDTIREFARPAVQLKREVPKGTKCGTTRAKECDIQEVFAAQATMLPKTNELSDWSDVDKVAAASIDGNESDASDDCGPPPLLRLCDMQPLIMSRYKNSFTSAVDAKPRETNGESQEFRKVPEGNETPKLPSGIATSNTTADPLSTLLHRPSSMSPGVRSSKRQQMDSYSEGEPVKKMKETSKEMIDKQKPYCKCGIALAEMTAAITAGTRALVRIAQAMQQMEAAIAEKYRI